jgi:hypothetical protein
VSRQKHVNSLAAAEMGKIESRTITSDDMLVTEFWEKSYSIDRATQLPGALSGVQFDVQFIRCSSLRAAAE